MQFLSGLDDGVGRYFEDAAGVRLGSEFEIAGAEGDYEAPIEGGVGRYFETPAAAAAGEHFDITGVDANYQAPVAGVGRYMLDDTAFGVGQLPAATPSQLEAEGLLGLHLASERPHPALTIGIGLIAGFAFGYFVKAKLG